MEQEVFRLSEPVVNSKENLIGEVKSPGNSRRKGNNFSGFVGCPSTKSDKDDSKMNRRSNSPAKAKIKYRGLNGVQVEEGSRLDRKQESQQKVDQVSDTSEKATNKDISAEPSGLPVAAQVLQRKSDDEGDHSFSVGKSPQNEAFLPEKISGAGGLGEGTPKSERSNDMFCDDIFGASPAEVRKTGKRDGLLVDKSGLKAA